MRLGIRQRLHQRRQRRDINALRKRVESERAEAERNLQKLIKYRRRTEITVEALGAAASTCRPEDRQEIEEHHADAVEILRRINADIMRLEGALGETNV